MEIRFIVAFKVCGILPDKVKADLKQTKREKRYEIGAGEKNNFIYNLILEFLNNLDFKSKNLTAIKDISNFKTVNLVRQENFHNNFRSQKFDKKSICFQQ
jgi:hypothetical protein